ncbi:methylmalonyl-CoA epimerase [Actinopolyspora mzabensis]|uniref:Methylmalonyl-CoA epimerase n=1 Tax=Actinopolyspora mzabensis TaxID=995066 RepID=A0A1G9DN77_ACTMZ|nr:methylmalonyl-CoA epimerase [Actinopolyspora mzabensis]SDK65341.1 methylmalonyl-CoA epimerase [Actinopolyspora mzabensis]
MREELGELVTAVDHVGVAVADLDRAIDFYRNTFGLVATHRETNQEQGVHEAMLAAPDSAESDTRLQLLAPADESSTIAKFLDKNGPGLQQLAFRVTDVDAACTRLRNRDVRLLFETARRGTANSRVNFVHPKDAGGVLVELVEPA